MDKKDEIPLARIACEGIWYRGMVSVGSHQVLMSLNEYTEIWRASTDADELREMVCKQMAAK